MWGEQRLALLMLGWRENKPLSTKELLWIHALFSKGNAF